MEVSLVPKLVPTLGRISQKFLTSQSLQGRFYNCDEKMSKYHVDRTLFCLSILQITSISAILCVVIKVGKHFLEA